MGDPATNITMTTPSALELFKPYESFCKSMIDAYVVLDHNAKPIKVNSLVSPLVGQKSKQILKNDHFGELIRFEIAGQQLTIESILDNKKPTRFDEITGFKNDGTQLNLILGYYPLIYDDRVVGGFLLIRDVTAETNLQYKYRDKATESITDALTGLYNRNYFLEYINNQISSDGKLASPQTSISMVMMDIDHFKKINDTHGHQAGDYIIAKVSEIMRTTFRKTDVLCRYGGEEFLAILPGTDLKGASIAANKLILSIQKFDFLFENKQIPTTMSCGVSQINLGIESGKEAIARADEALYKSKHNGRNQVSAYLSEGVIKKVDLDDFKED